jgi:hypothetical protein
VKYYIPKKDTWFKENQLVVLLNDYGNGTGLFLGYRVCENPDSEGSWKRIGEEYLDEEMCLFEEFNIIER